MADEVTRDDFAKRLLKRLDAPVTLRNKRALVTWMQSEGSKALYNPMATTKKMPGSWSFNWVGVQNYRDLESGVSATLITLREPGHGYEKILRRLKKNAWAINTLRAIGASEWGTNLSLMLRVLWDVRRDYDAAAKQPIGQ